ncbi:MAG: hypothetical protein CVU55_00220 [Deltaproteobacteria bacterium HGW-Deltaproteobacteria-13]|jgi:hypothetical protein|nr:MAG: hypothetical protein CVU55_00220 [Deltaproteobacteria bacterium HGW-Deltaproteobacteria-13]
MNSLPSHIVTNKHLRITKKYFQQEVSPVFNEIISSISPVKRTYDIAGKTICMNFYSEKLLGRMSRAFAHIEKDLPGSPDLTICLWDSVSTKTHLASPWVNDAEYTYPREVNARMINHDSFLGIYLHGEETLNLYDEKNNTAYFWIYDGDSLPYRLSASPLRSILNWFLSKEGVHLMHGAAVSLNGKSVLLTAKGGSGKSTTALSCFFSGMSYLGDDYVTVKSGDVITTHSIFSSTKLFPQSFHDTFPALKDKIWNENGTDKENEKVTVFLSELYPQQVVREAPLHAIMIPVIKNVEETKIVPASKVQTMVSLLPATLFQLSLTKSDKMAELRSIVEKTPCYFLELGYDLNRVADTIKSFLTNEQ